MSVIEYSRNIYLILRDSENLLATINLAKGISTYGEELIKVSGEEYRLWNPSRSKLGAAIMKGLKENPVLPGSKILYLGAASGTTVSHVSDIIGLEGHVWAIDFAPRPLRDLVENVSRHRRNVSPILGDARKPKEYSYLIPKIDVIFADVAQPDQADIIISNAKIFLKEKGHILLSIKSRSIDVNKSPEEIYAQEIETIKKADFTVLQVIELEPYEIDHALVHAVK